MKIITQNIKNKELTQKGINLNIRREDLINPIIPGNKWRKLVYNLAAAKKRGNKTLLTFGGAFSNHIAATAAAGKKHNFNTIGIIRGEETLPLNNTLQYAKQCGMKFHYMPRSQYREKHTTNCIDNLKQLFGSFYLIPEGGSNFYAVNGCMEILNDTDTKYDYICCPLGTGATAAGIALSLKPHQKLLGFPALKGGDFLLNDMRNFINMITNDDDSTEFVLDKVTLINDYHFGGYAKVNNVLTDFLKDFNIAHNIKWDAIYNGKMAYGVFDLIKNNYFPKNSNILLIHTGGIQGIKGIEERYGVKIY